MMAKFKEAINQAISDFNNIEKAIEAAGVDVPYGTDTSEYGNKISEACQGNYQKGVQKGVGDGEKSVRDIIDPAIKSYNVTIPVDMDKNEYPYKIGDVYQNGAYSGEKAISDIIDPAIESHGVDIPEDMDKSEYANKVDDVYQTGFDDGKESARDMYRTMTNWTYFSYQNNRNSMVADLKFSDTSNGTSFRVMLYECDALTTIPLIDTSKGKDFYNMFSKCRAITTIPPIDTSNGTDFSYMFSACEALTTIPELDTSKGTTFSYMFSYCTALTTIPEIDTSKGIVFSGMFTRCNNLTTIPKLNMSGLTTTIYQVFAGCYALKNVTFEGTIPVRGNSSVFSSCSQLTVDSLMSFINALTNMSDTATYTITIGSTNLAKLTDEQIQIATDKKITLQ